MYIFQNCDGKVLYSPTFRKLFPEYVHKYEQQWVSEQAAVVEEVQGGGSGRPQEDNNNNDDNNNDKNNKREEKKEVKRVELRKEELKWQK
ncbi:hypothetical protein LXL04_027989 [Taraxacum kok-saghyz]